MTPRANCDSTGYGTVLADDSAFAAYFHSGRKIGSETDGKTFFTHLADINGRFIISAPEFRTFGFVVKIQYM
jgi:hypothetical protein